MDRTVKDALRQAATLTRAGRPFEATRALQAALFGQDGSAPSTPNAHGSGTTIAAPTILDLQATRVDRGRPAGAEVPPTAAPSADTLRRAAGKAALPLAETIRTLVAMRRSTGGAGARRAGPPPIPEGARSLARTFQGPQGSRDYRLYVPAAAAAGRPAGLVMMLHGCKQDPDDFAAGTGMNAKADGTGMIVVYPAQTAAANPSHCWNWFNAADQRRSTGEVALLAALASAVAAEFDVPSGAIFVAGLSAGGAMAAILVDAYPDVFSAAGIHSGLPAGAASDMPSAFAAMAGRGPAGATASAAATARRLIVFHGTADTVVHPVNGEAIVDAARRGADRVEREEGRSATGRAYRRIVYRTAGGGTRAEHWVLEGHGHAWSGGRPDGSYTDQNGPDASAEMMRFFMDVSASPSN